MRLIAHRGASAIAPENTLDAFQAAVAAGADGIELDVRLTADGALVVMHDDDVSRTTDGTGFVSRMTLNEVQELNAAAQRPEWRGRCAVPALEDVLSLVADRIPLILELKGAFHDGAYISAALVAEAIVPMIQGRQVVVSSFDAEATRLMRRLAPRVPTAITSFHGVDPGWALETAIEVGHVECHIPRASVSPTFVERAHAAAVAVLCWTVNEPEDVRAMHQRGLDGIFTDDPATARAALRDHS